ncbi:hypothetical protein D3C81_1167810 [compost metagenome]
MRQRHGVGPVADTDLATPDVVIELAKQLLALIHCLVVVEAGERRDVGGDRIRVCGTCVVLVPDIFQATGVQAQGKICTRIVIAAEVAQPGGVYLPPTIKSDEVIAQVARKRLAHGMQAPALHLEPSQAGVFRRYPGKAFRQQARIAIMNHGSGREYIPHSHHCVEGT